MDDDALIRSAQDARDLAIATRKGKAIAKEVADPVIGWAIYMGEVDAGTLAAVWELSGAWAESQGRRDEASVFFRAARSARELEAKQETKCPVTLDWESREVIILGDHRLRCTRRQIHKLTHLINAYPRRVIVGEEDGARLLRGLYSQWRKLPDPYRLVLSPPSTRAGSTRGTGRQGWGLVDPRPAA